MVIKQAAEAGLERLKLQVSQAEKGLTVEEVEGQLALGVAKLRNAEAQKFVTQKLP
ncbi:hypothetical protein KHA80_11890 [Anaerobacillus sp. HL2]|nr:hypothetical protein KHA80_11890 [Anaerobacillus sp. HL2]